MNCPYCEHDETKVLETRETEDGVTRRRRECLKCNKRFTTYEQIELTEITIVKKGGKKTAKEYWKQGGFLGKTWWMPHSMKSISWFFDTMKYGIPV